MATKSAVATKEEKTNLPVTWQDKLKAMGAKQIQQEASVQTGAFINTKGGILVWQGNQFPDNKFPAVVLDSRIEHAWYGGESYDPDNPQPPHCYAFGEDADEMRPHPKSVDPQNDTCKGCPKNAFGSAAEEESGKKNSKGKACKNIRRLALVSASKPTPEGIRKSEVAFLKVPVTSVKNWSTYVRSVAATEGGLPPAVCVTEIAARPDPKSTFKLFFENLGRLPEPAMAEVVRRIDLVQDDLVAPYPDPSEEEQQPVNRRPANSNRGKKLR